jgi:hypothetical protein
VSLIGCKGWALISEMCGWRCQGKCCGSDCPPCLLEGWVSSLCNVCLLAFLVGIPSKRVCSFDLHASEPGWFLIPWEYF